MKLTTKLITKLTAKPLCIVDKCNKQLLVKGMCNRHYRNFKAGIPIPPISLNKYNTWKEYIKQYRRQSSCKADYAYVNIQKKITTSQQLLGHRSKPKYLLHQLLKKAKEGDPQASLKLKTMFNITKVYTDKEIQQFQTQKEDS